MDTEASYKVLVEQKEALEKILCGYRQKLELSDNLRRAYDDLLPKFQEARQEIDRQCRVIGAQSEEIVSLKATHEDMKVTAREKECSLRQLTSAYEQMQMTYRQKVGEAEDRNRELATALHEAKEKLEKQEMKMSIYEKEMEGLKALLLESQKKCLEAEKRAQAVKELREHEEMMFKVEQEKAKIGEKLKWKVERFKHLEEAHAKLKKQFHESEEEWKAEKCRIIDEMCTLQGNLDIQTRAVESLQSRLQMCNQALAHEQSRRKLLEIQISESRVSVENALSEFKDARSEAEKLTQGRDKEIAETRNMLSSKASQLKELEIQKSLLEQENQDLRTAISELKVDLENSVNARIELDKLGLKQKRMFSRELDQKDRKMEALMQELAQLKEALSQESHLKACAEVEIKKLQVERETCMRNMEAAILAKDEFTKTAEEQNQMYAEELTVQEGKIEDLQQQIAYLQETLLEMGKLKSETEDNAMHLQGRFERVKKDLEASFQTNNEIEKLLEKQINDTAQLLVVKDNKIEDLLQQTVNLQDALLRTSKSKQDAETAASSLYEEIEACRKELESLARAKMQVDEAVEKERQNFTMELQLKDKETVNLHQEIANLQEELQLTSGLNANSKSAISDLQKEYDMITEELKAEIQEREKRIEDLRQETTLMRENFASQQTENTILTRIQTDDFLEKETGFLKAIQEKDTQLKDLHSELDFLEQENAWKEIEAVVTLEQIQRGFDEINMNKDKAISDLQDRILSQEQLAKSVETAITLELADRQFEIDALHDSLKRMLAIHFLDMQQNEFSYLIIHELEQEVHILDKRLDLEDRQLSDLKNHVNKLKLDTEAQRSEFEDIVRQTRTKEKSLVADMNRLQSVIMERDGHIMQLLSEREFMVSQVEQMTENIGKISQDENLMRELESILEKSGVGKNTLEIIDNDKSHSKTLLSKHKTGISSEVRLPLKEQNCFVEL